MLNFVNELISKYIAVDERFWVACSFVIFCILVTPIFRMFFLKQLDQKILNIKQTIDDSIILNKDVYERLEVLKADLEKVKKESEKNLAAAKTSSELILSEASQKIAKLALEIQASNKQKLDYLEQHASSEAYKLVIDKVIQKVIAEVEKDPKSFINISSIKSFKFDKF